MASDPTKPLLRLIPRAHGDRQPGRPINPPRPAAFSVNQQTQRFGPQFRRLAEVLARDPQGLQLQADPAALAPERLLVFEVRGPIQNFVNAVRRVRGLELIDEEELVADEEDKTPVVYLLIPDARALQQVLSLWNRWRAGQALGVGFTPWRDVFELLRDLRPWGPEDRVTDYESGILAEEIEDRADNEPVLLEIELVFRASAERSAAAEDKVRTAIAASGGTVVVSSRIDDIAYHALLAQMPVTAVRAIAERNRDSLAGVEEIMAIITLT